MKFQKNDIKDDEWDYLGNPPQRFSNRDMHIYVYPEMFPAYSNVHVILGARLINRKAKIGRSPRKQVDADTDYCMNDAELIYLPNGTYKEVCQLVMDGELQTLVEMAYTGIYSLDNEDLMKILNRRIHRG